MAYALDPRINLRILERCPASNTAATSTTPTLATVNHAVCAKQRRRRVATLAQWTRTPWPKRTYEKMRGERGCIAARGENHGAFACWPIAIALAQPPWTSQVGGRNVPGDGGGLRAGGLYRLVVLVGLVLGKRVHRDGFGRRVVLARVLAAELPVKVLERPLAGNARGDLAHGPPARQLINLLGHRRVLVRDAAEALELPHAAPVATGARNLDEIVDVVPLGVVR
mmetsp:Transcript_45221/g.119337  ORF Transcript_45221/g.119337 Transcript_45221/m.119337 type:complete len:225 (+) Transcript_45221:47-721(+)